MPYSWLIAQNPTTLVTPAERLAAFSVAIQQVEGHSANVVAELAARHEALSLQDFSAVIALGAQNPIRMGALAEHLGLAPATVTPIVDRLEAQGLVRRRRSETDRRVWLVELAQPGMRVLEDLNHVYRQAARDMLAPLSDADQETFVRLFAKVANALQQPSEP